jgi:hypothetical protein
MVNAFLCFLLDVFGRAASVPSVRCSSWHYNAGQDRHRIVRNGERDPEKIRQQVRVKSP